MVLTVAPITPQPALGPAPRDHAAFSARRRITANKRAFKEIPRNTERVIPVSVRYTVPAGPTYREPQPIRDIYRVGEIFLRRLALEHAHLAPRIRSRGQKGAVARRCVTPTTAIVAHSCPPLPDPLHRRWGSRLRHATYVG